MKRIRGELAASLLPDVVLAQAICRFASQAAREILVDTECTAVLSEGHSVAVAGSAT